MNTSCVTSTSVFYHLGNQPAGNKFGKNPDLVASCKDLWKIWSCRVKVQPTRQIHRYFTGQVAVCSTGRFYITFVSFEPDIKQNTLTHNSVWPQTLSICRQFHWCWLSVTGHRESHTCNTEFSFGPRYTTKMRTDWRGCREETQRPKD